MAQVVQIEGVEKLLAAYKGQESKLASAVSKGLRKGGLYLMRQSLKLVPVDLGNLKASWFVRHKGAGFKTVVMGGYTAAYAVYVHENVEMKGRGQFRDGVAPGQPGYHGRYWDPMPQARSKFLEVPFKNEGQKIADIVRTQVAKEVGLL